MSENIISELKPSHKNLVDDYIKGVNEKTQNVYMLTIARDGEQPARSILYYSNAVDAAYAYNKYTDWGFAKNFLTVTLYEPSGTINQKILKRDQAGECTFIRKDYYDIQKILFEIKSHIDKQVYDKLCIDIMTVFAKDNWRFNPERFLKDLGVEYKLDS